MDFTCVPLVVSRFFSTLTTYPTGGGSTDSPHATRFLECTFTVWPSESGDGKQGAPGADDLQVRKHAESVKPRLRRS